MKLTPVRKLPRKEFRDHKDNSSFCQTFLQMNVKYAKVDFTPEEYKSVHSAYGSLRNFAAQQGYPFYVTTINGEIYFIRTDME